MEKIYNKLVRDEIPSIIINNGGTPYTKILNDNDYKLELEKKLLEEYNEVINTKKTEERIEELADMLEVIESLAHIEGKTLTDIIEVAKKKKDKRGGFDKKVFLEKVIEED